MVQVADDAVHIPNSCDFSQHNTQDSAIAMLILITVCNAQYGLEAVKLQYVCECTCVATSNTCTHVMHKYNPPKSTEATYVHHNSPFPHTVSPPEVTSSQVVHV